MTETNTIATKTSALLEGDIVFQDRTETDRIVLWVETDNYGDTWVRWTDGSRDSFPAGYTVYRIVG